MGNVAEKLEYLNDTKTAIKNAIVDKGGNVEDNATFRSYADSIANLPSGGGGEEIPEELLTFTGKCENLFTSDNWNEYINYYGNRIKTVDIFNARSMFQNNETIEHIPFEINCRHGNSNSTVDMGKMFYGCKNLRSIPKINNAMPTCMASMFENCMMLREIPEDFPNWFYWSKLEGQGSEYSDTLAGLFSGCYSLRKIPVEIYNHDSKITNPGYGYLTRAFVYCYVLDELKNLPIVDYTKPKVANLFGSTFSHCSRVKSITFETNNGVPKVAEWKTQTIELHTSVGFLSIANRATNYNSGITADKEVIDDATYQALKNDTDWYTANRAYSRYNRTSAVETINSLPDTSAYLATAGGTNTIKFKGDAGSKTDGGAINTMTNAEIAVATAKGWTVSYA
jgi:hypothetical protein